eukprot:s1296_g9.t1
MELFFHADRSETLVFLYCRAPVSPIRVSCSAVLLVSKCLASSATSAIAIVASTAQRTADAKSGVATERHVRFITKKLVDNLLSNGQALGKAFCEIDPERHYAVSKDQFANAIATACNHISHQAVEFLWASQFPGSRCVSEQENESLDNKVIDWRDFMGQLAHFAHNNRAPTPCTVQGRKRQYDLLQRTAPLTGGRLEDLELNRPDQNADDEVQIVGGNLCHRALGPEVFITLTQDKMGKHQHSWRENLSIFLGTFNGACC